MNHVTLSGTAFEPEKRAAKSGMAVLTFRWAEEADGQEGID